MVKTVLVFGASGTVGQGFLKASLDNDAVRTVGIFRSEESVKKVRERLGNPSEDKFLAVVGTVDSEANAAALYKRVIEKVGNYTDVVVTIGAFSFKNTLLELSVEELRNIVSTDRLEPNFLVAKHFLLPIQDKEGTSYTSINGSAAYQPYPNFGHITVANGALMKLLQVIMAEHKDKPIRINEFVIACIVTPWDDTTNPASGDFSGFPQTDSLSMGQGLLGVILHPNSKGAVMNVDPNNVKQIATTGTLTA